MLGYALTAAALGLATGLGYNCMAPASQLFGSTFTGINPGSRQIALTYDDGPSDPDTLRLLEVLERHQVKATFFMLGRFVTLRPLVAGAVVAAGHVVGNHTYTHPQPDLLHAGKDPRANRPVPASSARRGGRAFRSVPTASRRAPSGRSKAGAADGYAAGYVVG